MESELIKSEVETEVANVSVEIHAGAQSEVTEFVPLVMEGLLEIYRAFNFQDDGPSRLRIEALVRKCMAEREGLLCVGRVNGEPVGFALVGRRTNEITNLTYPFIHALWVCPKWRRLATGPRSYLADRIIKTALDEVGARGFTLAAAQVNYENTVWQAAVRRYGFRPNSLILTRAI